MMVIMITNATAVPDVDGNSKGISYDNDHHHCKDVDYNEHSAGIGNGGVDVDGVIVWLLFEVVVLVDVVVML